MWDCVLRVSESPPALLDESLPRSTLFWLSFVVSLPVCAACPEVLVLRWIAFWLLCAWLCCRDCDRLAGYACLARISQCRVLSCLPLIAMPCLACPFSDSLLYRFARNSLFCCFFVFVFVLPDPRMICSDDAFVFVLSFILVCVPGRALFV